MGQGPSIVIASDHAGLTLKDAIRQRLEEAGYAVEDLGTHSEASVDYPDFAHAVALRIEKERGQVGILCCGSGIGMSIAANRHRGVRAALCCDEEQARLARLHNDANVLCLGARLLESERAQRIVDTFLASPFEGGRHEGRVAKIEKSEAP